MIFLSGGYTSSDEFSKTIAEGIEAAFQLAAFLLIVRILLLIAIVALITWVVKKVWYAGENKERKRQQREWKKAQKKWKKQQDRAEWKAFQKYGTPSNPDFRRTSNQKFSNNPDWKWDEKAQLWRHKSQWDKM